MLLAVIFECVRTITNIYPNSGLIEMAATSIGRFLNSNNNNLKYLGLTALTLVVKVGFFLSSDPAICWVARFKAICVCFCSVLGAGGSQICHPAPTGGD